MLILKSTTVGFILLKGAFTKTRLHEGDIVYLTEVLDDYHFTSYNPDFERQMDLAEKIMHEDRELLHQLAQ